MDGLDAQVLAFEKLAQQFSQVSQEAEAALHKTTTADAKKRTQLLVQAMAASEACDELRSKVSKTLTSVKKDILEEFTVARDRGVPIPEHLPKYVKIEKSDAYSPQKFIEAANLIKEHTRFPEACMAWALQLLMLYQRR